ncbi:MAG TPA: hypothetical protein VK395_09070 [Gemmataceae bacterium]|nr:hypothetical protein [Gemmataceae bacterium]
MKSFLISNIQLWDTETGICCFQKKGTTGRLAISPDSASLAILDGKNSEFVTVLDIATSKERVTLHHGPELVKILFSPDGRELMTEGPSRKNVKLWDLASGKLIASYKHLELGRPTWELIDWRTGTERHVGVSSVALRLLDSDVFAVHGHTLATIGDDGKVYIADMTTGKQVASIKVGPGPNQLAFSPNGRLLAADYCEDGATIDWIIKVRSVVNPALTDWFLPDVAHTVILDLATGQRLVRLPCSLSFAFRPDGKTFVTHTEGEDVIRIWDVPAPSRLGILPRWPLIPVSIVLTTIWWFGRRRRKRFPRS